MKIAVVGTGNVGKALGRGWARKGHEIVFGVREVKNPKVDALLATIGEGAAAMTVSEALKQAGIVTLATPWGATEEIVASSARDLGGKVLIDCTNPIGEGLSGLTVGMDDSAGERLAKAAPEARVVKAFNTTGSGNMENPVYGGQPLSMFLCGDDADAKATVASLAEDLGFEAIDCGPISVSRYLEPMAMAWISLAYVQGWGTDFGFRVIRR